MRHIIGRPARALLPLTLSICAALGMGNAAALAAAIIISRVCSLCAGAAFRRVSGALVSEKRLRGNFLTAVLLTFAGGAGAFFLCRFLDKVGIMEIDIHTAAAGALAALAMCLSERLGVTNDRLSSPLCDAITAVLILAGMLISGGHSEYLTLAAALAAAVAAAICSGVYGLRTAAPGARVFLSVPAALLRTGLTPACLMAVFYFRPTAETACACCAAWAMYDWCDGAFRRDAGESIWLDLFMPPVIAACAALAAWTPGLKSDFYLSVLPAPFLAAACAMLFGSALRPLALLALATGCVAYASGCQVMMNLLPIGYPGVFRWTATALAAVTLGLCAAGMPDIIRRVRALRTMKKRARRP